MNDEIDRIGRLTELARIRSERTLLRLRNEEAAFKAKVINGVWQALVRAKLDGAGDELIKNTALVFGEISLVNCLTSTLTVAKSMSIITGVSPLKIRGLTVVGNAAAKVMTSSPGLMRLSAKL